MREALLRPLTVRAHGEAAAVDEDHACLVANFARQARIRIAKPIVVPRSLGDGFHSATRRGSKGQNEEQDARRSVSVVSYPLRDHGIEWARTDSGRPPFGGVRFVLISGG